MNRPVVLLAGPTASGKSALALALAERLEGLGGATIINADSMQVYRELRILTARPTPADERLVPHRLYGIRSAAEPFSAADWRDAAGDAVREAWQQGRVPLVVGGTGLYFRALLEGLAPVPDVPAEVRAETRDLMRRLGRVAFHERLAARDPRMAAVLRPADRQRAMRAWEVLEATGRSLADWQAEPPRGALEGDRVRAVLDVPRAELYARIDRRLVRMMEEGAADEVAALLGLGLAPDRPALRAVGVAEIADYLAGRIGYDDAIRRAQQASRRLAKRQLTWYRNQMSDWPRILQDSENPEEEIFAKIRH